MEMSDVRANRSLSTSIDSALDDDHVNFLLRDHQVKVHSVDLSGEQIQHRENHKHSSNANRPFQCEAICWPIYSHRCTYMVRKAKICENIFAF